MAYKKGDIEWREAHDARTVDYDRKMYLALPHSCDSWIVGGRTEALQLIADLQELIAKHFED